MSVGGVVIAASGSSVVAVGFGVVVVGEVVIVLSSSLSRGIGVGVVVGGGRSSSVQGIVSPVIEGLQRAG